MGERRLELSDEAREAFRLLKNKFTESSVNLQRNLAEASETPDGQRLGRKWLPSGVVWS